MLNRIPTNSADPTECIIPVKSAFNASRKRGYVTTFVIGAMASSSSNIWITDQSSDKISLSNQINQAGTMPRIYLPEDIDKEIAAMSTEELVEAIKAMAGTWADLPDPTEEPWGFIDWGDLEDEPDLPV